MARFQFLFFHRHSQHPIAGVELQNEHMSSFMTLSHARMSNLDAMLRQQSSTFSDALLAESHRSAKHDTAVNVLLYTLFSKFADSSLLHHQVNDLYDGLQMLLAGLLPSSLIPFSVLKQTTKAMATISINPSDSFALLKRVHHIIIPAMIFCFIVSGQICL